MTAVLRLWVRLVTTYRARLASSGLGPESGQTVNEWLGISALAVIAIVAIGAALKVLGLDVVEWIRGQLGV